MWQREEEVFGSTEFPSPVTVRVLDRPELQLIDPSYGDRFGPIAYALFSAVENQQQVVKEGVSWRLHLSWDGAAGLAARRQAQNAHLKKNRRAPLPDTIEDITADLDSAFKAWCAFGGLGARTRRGCGAVHCASIAPELPDLFGKVLVGRPQSNALEAWKEAVKAYRDFRQSPRRKEARKDHHHQERSEDDSGTGAKSLARSRLDPQDHWLRTQATFWHVIKWRSG